MFSRLSEIHLESSDKAAIFFSKNNCRTIKNTEFSLAPCAAGRMNFDNGVLL